MADDRDMVTVSGEQMDVNVYFGLQSSTFNNSITARIVNETMAGFPSLFYCVCEHHIRVLRWKYTNVSAER